MVDPIFVVRSLARDRLGKKSLYYYGWQVPLCHEQD